MVILGIDGGGSKTYAALTDAQDHILGRGLAGASNYQGVGAEASYAALDLALHLACTEAGVLPASIAAACLGMAGASRPEDHDVFAAWAAARLPAARFRLVNDAQLLLAAGVPAGWGLAVIAGTGSIAYATDASGRTHRAGGWGYLLGDEGSGYAIGLAALRAVVTAHDGRAPSTTLTRAVLDHWGLQEPRDLVHKVYRPPVAPVVIASLAALVDRAALDGDPVASAILTTAAQELVKLATAAVRPLTFEETIPTALAGGVLTGSAIIAAAFTQAAAGAGLRLHPISAVREPVLGAVRLASALLDEDPS